MNQMFSFERLDIEGLVVINPFCTYDERGYFAKSYEKDIYKENGIDTDIQEEFESLSKKGVIRGLHFQSKEPQSKIIKVLYGEIFDVAVDLRNDSATYGKWAGITLSADNKKALYVPSGFAHGFLTLSETSLVSYRCTGRYLKDYDTGIRWDDKDIAIDWPTHLVEEIIVSKRDVLLGSFEEFKNANK